MKDGCHLNSSQNKIIDAVTGRYACNHHHASCTYLRLRLGEIVVVISDLLCVFTKSTHDS